MIDVLRSFLGAAFGGAEAGAAVDNNERLLVFCDTGGVTTDV